MLKNNDKHVFLCFHAFHVTVMSCAGVVWSGTSHGSPGNKDDLCPYHART